MHHEAPPLSGRETRRASNCRLTVARVMAKAALLEQTVMSGSRAMIFFTRDTTRRSC